MPDVYDIFAYPDITVGACRGEAEFRRALIDAFPDQRPNIEQYFRDLKSATGWTGRHIMAQAVPAPLSWLIQAISPWSADTALQITGHYLEHRFRDPRLRAVLTSQ